MTLNSTMLFKMKTLIDITPTYTRRTEDRFMYNQHQNYMTAVQTLGLRSNPSKITVDSGEEELQENEFGTRFKGKHKVWTLTFEVEREGSLEVSQLVEDFDLVPFIKDLDETIDIQNPVFQSTDMKNINTVFYEI